MFALGKELTLSNAVEVSQAGRQAILQGQAVIDLSPLQMVDSSAVAVLLAWQRAALGLGRQVQFSGISSDLNSLMALYGVTEFVAVP